MVLPGYWKSYQRIWKCTHNWPLRYISRSNQGGYSYFRLKMSNLVYAVIVKVFFCMNDCLNTCNQIHIKYFTLTFISRSYLGQKPVKTANSLKNLHQHHKCQRWSKSCFIISKRSFLKFVWGNYLLPIFFW
jgi:hypothetical protein